MNLRDDERCDCGDLGAHEHAFFDCRLVVKQTFDKLEDLRGTAVI